MRGNATPAPMPPEMLIKQYCNRARLTSQHSMIASLLLHSPCLPAVTPVIQTPQLTLSAHPLDSPPSMIASLLPMQAVPTGSPGPSSGTEGECHSLASMDTHLQAVEQQYGSTGI